MSPVTLVFAIYTLLRLSIAADNTTLKEEGDPCTTSDDCNEPDEVYECQSGICMCNTVYAYIPSEKRPMCLAPISYGYACKYDEQCQYYGPGYACVAISGDNFLCECASGYTFIDYGYCDEEVFWTFGKAAGLGVGCIFALCITAGICGFLMYFVHHKLRKQTPEEQPEAVPSVSKITEDK